MSQTVQSYELTSPFSNGSFDIFNHEHQMLIPATMELLKRSVSHMTEGVKNTSIIFGPLESKMTARTSDFKDSVIHLVIVNYEDNAKGSNFLFHDIQRMQYGKELAVDSHIIDTAIPAVTLLEQDHRDLSETDDLGRPYTNNRFARVRFEEQASTWLDYQVDLALLKRTEVVRFLVDNDYQHSWERRTYYEFDADAGTNTFEVVCNLVIADPKIAAMVKLMLSK